jgi:D-arabinose 1-dehydrogenase-like Zn-dependent alcohol dehydrogenase
VVIGATTGGAPPADLQRIFVRQLEIYGSTTGNFAEFQAMVQVFAQGRLNPVIDSVRPMDDTTKALDRLEAGEQFGKLVITIP